jgi:tetratricopeptide (TPR) repeat protein
MTARSTFAAWALAASALFGPGVAHADTAPSLWERARDPEGAARFALHVKVRQVLAFDAGNPLVRFGALDRVRAVLEAEHAEASPDVRLRFDLGEVYYGLELHEDAVRVLGPAVREHENHPAALEAMVTLAYSHAKLDHPREERDAYRLFLTHAVDAGPRATATLNLAEAEMRLGDLKVAVATYEEAIRIANGLPSGSSAHETTALAMWGLAVALDRAGESGRARAEAARAASIDPNRSILGGPQVFFVPAYEIDWYLAVGAAAEAAESTSPHNTFDFRKIAEDHFRAFVTKARPDDRWLPLAKARLREAERLRAAAERVAKTTKRPTPPPDPSKTFTF